MSDRIADDTPILVGVGQASERRGEPDYRALSPTALAAEAAKYALADALSLELLGPEIDVVVAVRTTADSRPVPMRSAAAPFGYPENVPGVVAERIGAIKARGVYSPACGDEPQKLVGEFCERLHRGECRLVVICGGEATSTVRAATIAGEQHNWREHSDNALEDRGPQIEGLRVRLMADHKLAAPLQIYPLFEQARRKRLGLSREVYRREIGQLFAPFTNVAAINPHAFSRKRLTAEQIASVDENNRMVADPHTRLMVAREQVNLGAAVVLTTAGFAREHGIPSEKWVFLHGYASTSERSVLEREDFGRSPAMRLAYEGALGCAGVTCSDLTYLDIYSCFPVAVFSALDDLGLKADDPRGLTVTGGLPYFGGPGNNYALHAIVSIVMALRAAPGSLGMVGANGGFLSTHAVGIYSTTPRRWKACDSSDIQRRIDELASPVLDLAPDGLAAVETYTVLHDRSGPKDVVVVGRLLEGGARFLATNAAGDSETVARFSEQDGFDHCILVKPGGATNNFVVVDRADTARRAQSAISAGLEHDF